MCIIVHTSFSLCTVITVKIPVDDMWALWFQGFQQRFAPIQAEIDIVNDQANELQAADVILSHFNVRRLEDFNTRLFTFVAVVVFCLHVQRLCCFSCFVLFVCLFFLLLCMCLHVL